MTPEQMLDAFAALNADWDSYGALPISPVAIEKARILLASLAVVPLPSGGVQVEIGDVEIEAHADTTEAKEAMSAAIYAELRSAHSASWFSPTESLGVIASRVINEEDFALMLSRIGEWNDCVVEFWDHRVDRPMIAVSTEDWTVEFTLAAYSWLG